MENSEKKNSKVGVIIIIIIVILLLLFAIWFFLLRDNGSANNTNNNTNTQTNTNTNTDQPDTKEIVEYDYRDGVLTQIVDEEQKPLQNDFVIDGIILIGNRHSYYDTDDTDTIINNFVSKGYNKEGINSSFYLNEWIEFYVDTKYTGSVSDVKIYIIPHHTVEEYQKMSNSELTELAETKGAILEYTNPDVDNYKYIGNTYVNMDYQEGKYDILFLYRGKLAYFINIILTKEPTE